MSQGHLTQLIHKAKDLLVGDPFWYRSFKDSSNSLEETIGAMGGKVDLLADKELATSAAVLSRLTLQTRWLGPSKVTQITAVPETSQVKNLKFYTATTRRVLSEFYDSIDWANQKGSDSPIDAAMKNLSRAVKMSGGRVASQDSKAKRTSGVVKTEIRRGELVHKVTNEKQNQFDFSLMALLNAKLPPAVRSNMGSPALNYRTGRFANSAKIVGVEQTPQGFPRLLYTYQKAPYDVFDSMLGAAPWNTPGRDPKKLIETSIRDIAREMAIGRFYTRRT